MYDVEGFTPRGSKCSCMYHHGEFAIVECTIDPSQTARNIAALHKDDTVAVGDLVKDLSSGLVGTVLQLPDGVHAQLKISGGYLWCLQRCLTVTTLDAELARA